MAGWRLLLGPKRKKFVRTNDRATIAVKMMWGPKGIFGRGKIKSMSSALARPYKKLFDEGKPIGRINHLFFKGNKWPSHVLGSLCFTPGQQLLFFLGLIDRKVNWFMFNGLFRSIKSTGFVDHLTLEKGFRKWHLTILEPDGTKKLHMPSFRTKDIGNNTIFWFCLTIQEPHFLETTPEELTLSFTSSSQDAERQSKLPIKARERAIFHLITLNKMLLNEGEFLHFDFFIGPSDLDTELLPCFVPTHEPIVYGYAQAFKEGTHFRSHPVSLEGITEKIWVVVSKHVGKVSDKAIMGCV